MLLSGRTRVSSRGQVVIPKALRDVAGLVEGDEVDVLFDGERISLSRVEPDQASNPAAPAGPCAADRLAEARTRYGPRRRAQATHGILGATPVSSIWADRIAAVAAIRQLSTEFSGTSASEILRESRDELERRG